MRYFDALGLEPRLALDPDDLKARFYERSRQWHPDRFTRASAAEQAKALEMTSMLNDAFRTLKEPVARAEYFLRESGLDLTKEVPPELLEEVFELNMALEEMRSGDESARPQLEAAETRFRQMLADNDRELHDLFEKSSREPVLEELRQTLNRRKYVTNLVRDVEKELHVHVSD
jgi:molecular chaperone HscB